MECSIRLDEESDNAVLEVSDDGGGMSSEELERCLEPFFTTKTKGSGLGLSECHGVVRQHGGMMDIVSSQGSGTKVRVLLPLAETGSGIDAGAKGLNASQESANAGIEFGRADKHDKPRVLCIDDDAIVQCSMKALLRTMGVQVVTADDGPSGLKLLAESMFQLVICDQGLPGMDGIAVLSEIKRQWPDLPVIIISGWSLSEISGDIRPDEFLEKPASYDDLRAALQRHLQLTSIP